MIEKCQESMKTTWSFLKTFMKWMLCGSMVGVVGGGVGTLFHHFVIYAGETQHKYPWMIWFLPLGGLAIVWLYRLSKMSNDPGTNMIIESIRSSEKIPTKMAPLIFISTTITHLFGGSSGREGAALQIGGSLGALMGRWIHLDEKDLKVITKCGMSAVFAAVFGTPLTATIFSMEVISVGVIYYMAFIPCIVAALIGHGIAVYMGVTPDVWGIIHIPETTIITTLQVIFLAGLCAVVSILFCAVMHKSAKWYRRYLPNPYIRVVVGAFLMIAFTYLVGSRAYNGAGIDVIDQAIAGIARPEAFALKILATAITLGAGFKGGEIVPVFFIGSTFGCVVGGLIGLDPGFGAAIGLIALFCGVVNCPMASLILSVELFGAGGILLFAVACGVSYMLSGYHGLYSSQKIIYSKLKPHYVNVNIHIS